MGIPARIREYLTATGTDFLVLTHRKAYTAEEAARAMGLPPGKVSKTVIVEAHGKKCMAVVPADRRLSLEVASDAFGDPHLKLVPESEFRALFPDCEIGTMPPFGNLYGMRLIVDSVIGTEEAFIFQAGSHVDAIRMSWREYSRLESPKTRDISEPIPARSSR